MLGRPGIKMCRSEHARWPWVPHMWRTNNNESQRFYTDYGMSLPPLVSRLVLEHAADGLGHWVMDAGKGLFT